MRFFTEKHTPQEIERVSRELTPDGKTLSGLLRSTGGIVALKEVADALPKWNEQRRRSAVEDLRRRELVVLQAAEGLIAHTPKGIDVALVLDRRKPLFSMDEQGRTQRPFKVIRIPIESATIFDSMRQAEEIARGLTEEETILMRTIGRTSGTGPAERFVAEISLLSSLDTLKVRVGIGALEKERIDVLGTQ
jgi:hypothetical protein